MHRVKSLGSKKNGYVPGSEVALGSERHILPDKQGKEINNKKAFIDANDVLVVLKFWPNLMDIVKVYCDNLGSKKNGYVPGYEIAIGSERHILPDKQGTEINNKKACLGANDVLVVLTFWPNLP